MKFLLLSATILASFPAMGHDTWADGSPVPPWVKAQCCGTQDVHHLSAGRVHIMADGYHIDGIKTVVPMTRALPSMDGDFWAFWSPLGEPEPVIFCFFAPLHGV